MFTELWISLLNVIVYREVLLTQSTLRRKPRKGRYPEVHLCLKPGIYVYVWVISFAVSFNTHHDTNYITWERASIEELFNSNLPVTTSEEIVSIDDCCRRFSPLRAASFLRQGPELVKKPSWGSKQSARACTFNSPCRPAILSSCLDFPSVRDGSLELKSR